MHTSYNSNVIKARLPILELEYINTRLLWAHLSISSRNGEEDDFFDCWTDHIVFYWLCFSWLYLTEMEFLLFEYECLNPDGPLFY